MKKQQLLLVLFVLILVFDCANQSKNIIFVQDSKKELPLIPAGVDSSLALEARKRAAQLFSPVDAQQKADSIQKDVQDYVKIVRELYEKINLKKDSLKLLRAKVHNLNKQLKQKKSKLLEDKKRLEITISRARKDSATIDIVLSLLEFFLFDARAKLERAFQINPFDIDILFLSGGSENNRGRMYSDESAYRNAIKYFRRYLNHNRGNYAVYFQIAFSYYQLKEWDKAIEYARMAKNVYVITSYFDRKFEQPVFASIEGYKPPPYVDPNQYFELLKVKGLTEIWAHQPDSALATLNEAKIFAPTEVEKKLIESYIKTYIFWDGKNIANAERHLEILDSLHTENYDWAYKALKDLLPKLKTQKARHKVIWEIANIEYGKYERAEKAVELLYPVLAELDSVKETENIYELPADSAKQRYFIDCGKMLWVLGKKYRDLGEVKKSNKYLAMDTTIAWKGRAKAFLLINPDIPDLPDRRKRQQMYFKERLKLLFRAYSLRDDLEVSEADQMYREIIRIYQTMRDERYKYYFLDRQKYLNKRQGS